MGQSIHVHDVYPGIRSGALKVLESFKNGITAGQKGAKVIRHGESRRRGISGKAE